MPRDCPRCLLESDAEQTHIRRARMDLTLPPPLTQHQWRRHVPEEVFTITTDEVCSPNCWYMHSLICSKVRFSYHHHIRGGGGPVPPRIDDTRQPSGKLTASVWIRLPPGPPTGISLCVILPATPSAFTSVESAGHTPCSHSSPTTLRLPKGASIGSVQGVPPGIKF